MKKKLYKSAADKKICGVCGGLGEYLGIDPTFIRLVWLFLSFTGTGILVYIACAVIMPEDPLNDTEFVTNDENNHN